MLRFTKMHGLGNDFVVIDAIHQQVRLEPSLLQRLGDRHRGIGCDQILLVETPRLPGAEFHYRIFNADGSEVEQCGNGARCFARFVREQGLSNRSHIRVGTAAGLIELQSRADGQVRVDMGPPRLDPTLIPFLAERQAPSYELIVEEQTLTIGAVSMGNPHAVLLVEDVEQAPVATLGPLIERHARFPKGANVGFMQHCANDHIRLRVFERGTGETQACGSGACAAVVAGRLLGLLGPDVQVSLPGGDLMIEWQADAGSVWMTGPAETVFHGEIA